MGKRHFLKSCPLIFIGGATVPLQPSTVPPQVPGGVSPAPSAGALWEPGSPLTFLPATRGVFRWKAAYKRCALKPKTLHQQLPGQARRQQCRVLKGLAGRGPAPPPSAIPQARPPALFAGKRPTPHLGGPPSPQTAGRPARSPKGLGAGERLVPQRRRGLGGRCAASGSLGGGAAQEGGRAGAPARDGGGAARRLHAQRPDGQGVRAGSAGEAAAPRPAGSRRGEWGVPAAAAGGRGERGGIARARDTSAKEPEPLAGESAPRSMWRPPPLAERAGARPGPARRSYLQQQQE